MLRRIFLLLLLAVLPVRADDFYLHDGDTVVFYGDSITQQRHYTDDVESYVLTRFPGMNVRFVNSGWSGDKVTGGEGGTLMERLDRDVIPYHPTVVTVMLGMNDAHYRGFDDALFTTYQRGYEALVAHLDGTRMTLIEPSAYDEVTHPPAVEGYNGVLQRYGAFVRHLAEQHGFVWADANQPMVHALEGAHERDPELSQHLIGDRIHPGPAMHLLIAEAILLAWRAPAQVCAVTLDAESGAFTVVGAEVTANGPLSWEETDDALPFPVDLDDPLTRLVLKCSRFADVLDEAPLRVTHLTPGRYTLRIDDAPVGTFTADQLNDGINVALLNTPMLRQSRHLHELTVQHNRIHFVRWREVDLPLSHDTDTGPTLQALDALEQDLIRQQHAAAQPLPHRYQLVRTE